MAYGLKYYWQKAEQDGQIIRLELHCKDWTGTSYELGAVTGFSLKVQGDQTSITSPIIKTSVDVSLKDVFDVGTTQTDGTTCVTTVDGVKYKWGQWEEFYTNDATKFKVIVLSKASASASSWTTQWTGYITPDSWGEEMTYRGTINLTARDMLGYLDEQEFDLTGRVSLRSLISSALTKAVCGMTLNAHDSECLYNSNGQNILDHTIAAATYAGESWYQALEKTLEAVGMVLRYVGGNTLTLTSIRYAADYTTAVVPAFTNRSGYRELDPAIKQIVEVFNPDIVDYETEYPEASQYTQGSTKHKQSYTCGTQTFSTQSIYKQTLAAASSGNGWRGTLAVPRNAQAEAAVPDYEFFIPTDTDTSEGDYAEYMHSAILSPVKVGFNATLCPIEGEYIIDSDVYSINKIRVQFLAVVGSDTKYYNGSYAWGSSAYTWELDNGSTIEIPECTDATAFKVRIIQITTICNVIPRYSMTAFLAVSFGNSEAVNIPAEVKTTTIYNDENHVEISRTPAIGSVTSNASIQIVRNALAYGNAIVSDAWKFTGDSATYPLAVLVHAQLLVFNASQLGNSIFTGNLIAANGNSVLPGTKYTYFQKNCVLLSGTFNFCTGGVDSATLREALSWSDIWGSSFAPTYTRKESAEQGGTSSAGGSGSSSGGGSGSGGTKVSWGTEVTDRIELTVAGTSKTLATEGHITDTDNPHNTTFANLGGSLAFSQLPDIYVGTTAVQSSSAAQALTGIKGITFAASDSAASSGNVLEVVNIGTSASPVYALHSVLPIYSDGEITAGGAGSGGSGSSGVLYSLNDVYHSGENVLRIDGTARQNGDLLAYNSTQAKWVALAQSSVVPTLNTLTLQLNGTTVGTYNPSTAATLNVSGVITTSNISSQSVSYATTAGSAPASDVYSWAKASTKPSYTTSEVSEGSNLYFTNARAISACSGTYLPLSGGTITGNLTVPYGRRLITAGDWANNNGLYMYEGSGSTTFGGYVLYGESDQIHIGTWSNSSTGTDALTISRGRTVVDFKGTPTISGTYTIYHSGNCNNTSTAWICSSLTMNGALSGATTITASSTATASGFIKSGSSDSYVLLGGGGHKAESSLSVAYASGISSTTPQLAASVENDEIVVGSRDDWGYWGAGDGYILEHFFNFRWYDTRNYFGVIRGSGTNSAGFGWGYRYTTSSSLVQLAQLTTGGDLYLRGLLSTTSVSATGNITATGEVTAGSSSDARFKDNQTLLRNADSVLKALKPMEFEWNALYKSLGGTNEGHDVGFIAQDVQTLIPSAIGKVYGDYLRLDYNKVTPYLVAGWQSHETELDRLRRRVSELESEVSRLSSLAIA